MLSSGWDSELGNIISYTNITIPRVLLISLKVSLSVNGDTDVLWGLTRTGRS